jgi:hypothetical protein
MNDARAGTLPAVRSGLWTLVYCFAAHAAITLFRQAAFVILKGSHAFSLIDGTATFSSALSIAVALTAAMVIARFGVLPPRLVVPAKETAAKAAPYRTTPEDPSPTDTVETSPAVVALARWTSIAAWCALGAEAASFLWWSVAGAVSNRSMWQAFKLVIGLSSTFATTALAVLFVVWTVKVARDARGALPVPLVAAVLVLVAGRGAFFTWRQNSLAQLPDAIWWISTAVTVAIDAGMALAAVGLGRCLGGLPPQEEGDESAAKTAETRWIEAARGLARYTTLLKIRITLVVCGGMLGGLAAASGSLGVVGAVGVLTPLASAIAGLAMIVALARFARLPEDTRASALATAAVGLFGAGWLGEVDTLLLILQIFGRSAGLERLSYLQFAISVLAMAGHLALLVSFGRLAASMQDMDLSARCRSIAVLTCVLVALVVGLGAVLTGGNVVDVVVLMVMGGAVVLVCSLVLLVKYFRVLRDLETAMAVRSGRKYA